MLLYPTSIMERGGEELCSMPIIFLDEQVTLEKPEGLSECTSLCSQDGCAFVSPLPPTSEVCSQCHLGCRMRGNCKSGQTLSVLSKNDLKYVARMRGYWSRHRGRVPNNLEELCAEAFPRKTWDNTTLEELRVIRLKHCELRFQIYSSKEHLRMSRQVRSQVKNNI